MGSFGPVTTVGEGHTPLPSAEAVDHLELRMTAFNLAKTRFVGDMYPRGVWHVGQAGLGAFPDDSAGLPQAAMLYTRFLHQEMETWFIAENLGRPITATSLWWRWLIGCTVEITVFW